MDGVGVYNWTQNPDSPNAVHPGKAGFNAGMSAYGMWLNPIAPTLYFGMDAFYPGGWFGNENGPGALPVLDRVQSANQQILGTNWRILPYNKL
ncbi:hypothetical protein [Flavobacterium lindanitolerans]|uniref:hypothetical protein n=1 Tax=Flavobacterium lindanitolerans TaxID=428988 RepID=UPI0031CE8924